MARQVLISFCQWSITLTADVPGKCKENSLSIAERVTLKLLFSRVWKRPGMCRTPSGRLSATKRSAQSSCTNVVLILTEIWPLIWQLSERSAFNCDWCCFRRCCCPPSLCSCSGSRLTDPTEPPSVGSLVLSIDAYEVQTDCGMPKCFHRKDRNPLHRW